MKMLNTPADWIGQIRFTGLPLLSSEELKEAQKSLMKAYVDTQHILNQPGKNHDGYGYKYADLNDVISSIQAATKELDIAYIQQPVTHGGQTGIHNYLINSQGAIFDFGSYLIDLGKPSPQEHGKCLTMLDVTLLVPSLVLHQRMIQMLRNLNVKKISYHLVNCQALKSSISKKREILLKLSQWPWLVMN